MSEGTKALRRASVVLRTSAVTNEKIGSDRLSGTATNAAAVKPLAVKTAAPNDPTLSSMRPSMRFAARLRKLRELPDGRQIAEGRRLLKARSAEDRALGGVLLFLNQELDWNASAAVAKDGNLLVPLAVFDWIRDFGSDDEVATFYEALGAREISDEELTAFLETSASQVAGGRSALDLLLARNDEETVSDALEPVVLSPGVAYDVREQALFKLLEPENKASTLELLEKLTSGQRDGESLLAESLAKWTTMAHLSDPDDEEVPYKVWDTPIRELSFLAESELGLAVRTMANYLEYGLRRDDPDFEPVVEEGAYETAKTLLDRALASRETLLPEEEDALDRLSANVERLVSYDPAFVVDENEFSDDFDEEVDVEILDAEDAYLADLLAEDDVGDEDEEDDNPPGVQEGELDEDEDDEDEEEDEDDEDDDDGNEAADDEKADEDDADDEKNDEDDAESEKDDAEDEGTDGREAVMSERRTKSFWTV